LKCCCLKETKGLRKWRGWPRSVNATWKSQVGARYTASPIHLLAIPFPLPKRRRAELDRAGKDGLGEMIHALARAERSSSIAACRNYGTDPSKWKQ
jgi:hypothetical protein